MFFSEPLQENCKTKIYLCLKAVPPPSFCCRLCHSPRCQLTPLVLPAPILQCLCLLSAGASLLCCRLLLSTGAFTSTSCHASTSRHNSALRHARLIWLVVTFPITSTSPSCRASARRLGLRHLLCPSCLIGCPIAQHLNTHHIATPPGALAPLVDSLLLKAFGAVCHRSCQGIFPVRRHLPQSGRPPNIAISVVVAARAHGQCGAFFAFAIAAGTLTCVRCQHGVSPVVARHTRLLAGHGPEEGASPS